MKLFEYEAKQIFRENKIPVPKGVLVSTPDEAVTAFHALNGPVVVKSQVLVGGRGKAGGIRFADSAEQARQISSELLGSTIKGVTVHKLLIEEKLSIAKELYVGFTVDRSARSYVALASSEGGVDIEEVAMRAPSKIARLTVPPEEGFHEFHARLLAHRIGYKGEKQAALSSIIYQLLQIAMKYDAELIEINPLVGTTEGKMVAADARLLIDDNALFRHKDFERSILEREGELSPLEKEAKRFDMAYVDLDGEIGIIGNGAGLVMATLDLVTLYGGRPANFLDVGGGASAETVKQGLKIIFTKPAVKSVCINIMGGITQCDVVATGILDALKETKTRIPIAIRLMGTREEVGRRILKGANIKSYDSMEDVVRNAVKLARG